MASRREQLIRQIRSGETEGPAVPQAGEEEGVSEQLLRGSVEKDPPVSVVSPLIREKKSKGDKPELPFTVNDGGEDKPRKTARNTASERHAAEIGDALYDKMVTFFAMLSGFLPVTSVYAVENSEKAINALVNIGKRNPKVLAILAKTANGVDALELGKFVIGILVCVQVDTGRAQGDELIARAMGVTAIIDEHFGENRSFEQNDAVLMQEAPRFAAV